jgi:hypothetical protein
MSILGLVMLPVKLAVSAAVLAAHIAFPFPFAVPAIAVVLRPPWRIGFSCRATAARGWRTRPRRGLEEEVSVGATRQG